MLKASPWGELDPACQQHAFGSSALGDRSSSVHRWKSRKKNWSHTGTWDGAATELMAKYRARQRRSDPLQARTVHAEHDLPRLPGDAAQPESHAVRVGGTTLVELGAMPIGEAGAVLRRPGRRSERDGLSRHSTLSRTIAEELLKEIRGRLGFLINVGLALPGTRSGSPHPLRRRGAADPPGRPDRLRPRRGALHPGRTVDRPPSSRQRPADRDLRSGSATWATRSSSSSTTKTRCARPTTSSTSAPARGPRRRGGRRRADRGARRGLREPDRSVSLGRPGDRGAQDSQERADGRVLKVVGARQNNLKGDRRRGPARPVRAASPGSAAPARARWSTTSFARRCTRDLNGGDQRARQLTTGSKGSNISTSSSTSTSRRSAGRRGPTRRPTSSCSTRSATCTPSCPTPRPAATRRAASASTSKGAAARRARGTGRTASRWTSSPTSG